MLRSRCHTNPRQDTPIWAPREVVWMTFFTPLEHSGFDLPHVFSDEALNVSSDGALVNGGAQSLDRLSNDVPILESLHQQMNR
jgi:hypothetical protein